MRTHFPEQRLVIEPNPEGDHCKLMTRSHGRWRDPGPRRAGDACRNIKLNLLKGNNRCARLRPENDTTDNEVILIALKMWASNALLNTDRKTEFIF